MKERRDFSDEAWLQMILKAAQRRETNTAKTKMEFHVMYELFKDNLVVFQSSQN